MAQGHSRKRIMYNLQLPPFPHRFCQSHLALTYQHSGLGTEPVSVTIYWKCCFEITQTVIQLEAVFFLKFLVFMPVSKISFIFKLRGKIIQHKTGLSWQQVHRYRRYRTVSNCWTNLKLSTHSQTYGLFSTVV